MAKSDLSPQQQLFVDTLSATLDEPFDSDWARMCYARDVAGYSDKTNPMALLRSKAVKEAVREVLSNALTMHSFKATRSLVAILNNPTAPGNKQLLDAAKEVLDRGGVVKDLGIELDTEVKPAVLIIPAKS